MRLIESAKGHVANPVLTTMRAIYQYACIPEMSWFGKTRVVIDSGMFLNWLSSPLFQATHSWIASLWKSVAKDLDPRQIPGKPRTRKSRSCGITPWYKRHPEEVRSPENRVYWSTVWRDIALYSKGFILRDHRNLCQQTLNDIKSQRVLWIPNAQSGFIDLNTTHSQIIMFSFVAKWIKKRKSWASTFCPRLNLSTCTTLSWSARTSSMKHCSSLQLRGWHLWRRVVVASLLLQIAVAIAPPLKRCRNIRLEH